MPIPIIIDDYFFRDDFYSRRGQLEPHWRIESGSFSLRPQLYMRVDLPGELVYSGTPLNSLRKRIESINSNFAIIVRFFAREDMKFEIRGRRMDNENFISFAVDFENKTAKLSSTITGSDESVQTTIHNRSYDLKFEGLRYYSVELWMHNEELFGFINRDLAVSGRSSDLLTEDGFSILVPEVYLDDKPKFNLVAVHDLIEQRDRQLPEDGSNLWIKFRDLMTEHVNSLKHSKDWRSYALARQHWARSKNLKYRNEIWNDLGYPFHQPRSEEWASDNA